MDIIELDRRQLLQKTAIGSLALPGLLDTVLAAAAKSKIPSLPPVRAITAGPKFHWFSYYDKLQFDPSGRYVLGMEVDFEHRSPKRDDVVKIGMVDLRNGEKWTQLGESRS